MASNLIKRLLRGRPKHAREPQVAGHLYPEQPVQLQALIMAQLRTAQAQLQAQSLTPDQPPRALIVPFGDLKVAGQVAALAYACLIDHREAYDRVAIFAPALRIPFAGVGFGGFDALTLPGGSLWVDIPALERLMDLCDEVKPAHEAHRVELAIEAQLPYLHELNPQWELLPILAGDGSQPGCETLLGLLFEQPRTLILVCAELSSELPPDEVDALDQESVAAILALEPERLGRQHTSARHPLKALLTQARALKLEPVLLERRGSEQLVEASLAQSIGLSVGYAALAFYGAK